MPLLKYKIPRKKRNCTMLLNIWTKLKNIFYDLSFDNEGQFLKETNGRSVLES